MEDLKIAKQYIEEAEWHIKDFSRRNYNKRLEGMATDLRGIYANLSNFIEEKENK